MGPHFSRYLLRRWLWPILGALPFFAGLLLAFQLQVIAKEIADTPGGSYRYILPILLGALPEIVNLVMPMAAILGALMGTQHLSEGSELVASQGLGAGPKAVLRPWLLLGAALFAISLLNANLLVPAANAWQRSVRRQMVDEALQNALKPSAPPILREGRAMWVGADRELHRLEASGDRATHLVARRFIVQQGSREDTSILIKMEDISGASWSIVDGAVSWMNMREQVIRQDRPVRTHVLPPTALRYEKTLNLLGSPLVEAKVELSRRVALPSAAVALLLLGIGLGISHPRFHKGGALIRSLGVILLYMMVLRVIEDRCLENRLHPALLFLPPIAFGAWGALLLRLRLRPHHANRVRERLSRLLRPLRRLLWMRMGWIWLRLALRARRQRLKSCDAVAPERTPERRGLLSRWSSRSWRLNWLGTVAIFLALNFLIQFATLAADLSKNRVPFHVFLSYWAWGLPAFLALVLPIAFLFSAVITFSDAAVSHEWVALRAGGVSLVQWVRSAWPTWLPVLVLTLGMQVLLAPRASVREDAIYARIKQRAAGRDSQSPWLNLSSTGILWHMHGDQRWGFPLLAPGQAPVLLHWRMGESRAQALPWGGGSPRTGPAVEALFPEATLRNHQKADHIPTSDLARWQHWAPEPVRGTMLWHRLLDWLAGPCLLFAALSHAFPAPRKGRGQALGICLVVSLGFVGLQMIFGNAANAGEIPAVWGVMAPMLLVLSYGAYRLRALRT